MTSSVDRLTIHGKQSLPLKIWHEIGEKQNLIANQNEIKKLKKIIRNLQKEPKTKRD